FNDSVAIDVALCKEFGRQFQLRNPAGQPVFITSGFHISPSSSQHSCIGVEKIRYVPITDYFTQRAHAMIQPPLESATHHRGDGYAWRRHGKPKRLIGVETQREADWVADHVVGQNSGGSAEGIALRTPSRTRLPGVEPSAPH